MFCSLVHFVNTYRFMLSQLTKYITTQPLHIEKAPKCQLIWRRCCLLLWWLACACRPLSVTGVCFNPLSPFTLPRSKVLKSYYLGATRSLYSAYKSKPTIYIYRLGASAPTRWCECTKSHPLCLRNRGGGIDWILSRQANGKGVWISKSLACNDNIQLWIIEIHTLI